MQSEEDQHNEVFQLPLAFLRVSFQPGTIRVWKRLTGTTLEEIDFISLMISGSS